MNERNKFTATRAVLLQPHQGEKEKLDYDLSRQITPDASMFYYKAACKKKETYVFNRKENSHVFVIVLGDSFSFNYGDGKVYYPQKYDLIYSNRMEDEVLEFNESHFYENLVLRISSKTIQRLADKKGFKNYASFLMNEGELYINRANLKIIKKARQICDEASEGIEVVGHIFLLVELIIKQYMDNYLDTTSSSLLFQKWEIEELLKVSSDIEKNPGENYSVIGISKSTGIRKPRLQNGFKEMHDLTVALYIKEMRLRKAEQLIRKSDLNISEIVYKVGLSSKSYFSRIFKQKYGCSPSDYQKYYFI